MAEQAPMSPAILDQIVALRQALYRLVQDVDHLYTQIRQAIPGPTQPLARSPAMPNGIFSPHCPVCDSVNLDTQWTDRVFLNQGEIRLGLTCLHCGATWHARYMLHAYYHIERQGIPYPVPSSRRVAE